MAEYIDKDRLRLMKTEECAGHTIEYAMGWKACVEWVKSLPAADVRENVNGEWIDKDVFTAKGNVDMLQSAFCPNCKRYHTTPYSYYFTDYAFCPNCGAQMGGAEDD